MAGLTTESGYTSTLSAKLTAAATTMSVVTAPTVTSGRLYLKRGSTEEWISYTGVSGTTLTGLTRGLSQTADPASAGTGTSWVAGTVVTLVFMHDQTFDRQSPLPLTFATTAARDAALGADGAATEAWVNVYVTATGLHYKYNLSTAQWESVDTGTAVPNMSDTVTGKGRLADSAQSQAGTDTESGSPLLVTPSDIAANDQSDTFKYAADAEASDTYVIALTPALTAYTTGQKIRFKANTVNTGACTINVNALGAKSIKDRAGNDPVDGMIAANDFIDLYYDGTNFVIDSAPKLATDAEVTSATDKTKYITPDQLPKIAIVQTTRAIDTASGTVSIAHGLSRTPKYIDCSMRYTYSAGANISGFGSNGFSDGSVNRCTFTGSFDNGASVGMTTGNDASNCINFDYGTSASNAGQTATATFDGTNINLIWTKAGSLSGVTCYITITAFA